mgnify:CR=1 FL=1
MTDTARIAAGMSSTGAGPARKVWLTAAIVLAIAVSALLLAAGTAWFAANRPPGDTSLEAGFARDMIVHHDQAVAMALLARDRTTDPAVQALATDILLTQQNQIGQMLGWLSVWGLPATGTEPPMAWMGAPPASTMPEMASGSMTGTMPGMATAEEIAELASLTGEAADRLFLRLMIRHHQGAIPMAEMAMARSANPQVRTLATAIVAGQEAEITAMEAMLAGKEAAAA